MLAWNRYLIFYIIAGFIALRATSDFYRVYVETKDDVGSATTSIASCDEIERHVPIVDRELQKGIIELCKKREATAKRWPLLESANRFVERMWICNNIHCSEYTRPVLTFFVNYALYAFFAAMVLLLLFFYTILPALGNVLVLRFFTPKQKVSAIKEHSCRIDEDYRPYVRIQN